jgi:hypothetical protein
MQGRPFCGWDRLVVGFEVQKVKGERVKNKRIAKYSWKHGRQELYRS